MGKQAERSKKKAVDKAPRKTENEIDQQPGYDIYPSPTRETVKPKLQLTLTEAELEEEIPQMLTANNPKAPQNITRFSSKERCFKLEAMVEQCATHYATDGWLVYKHSEEGKKQIESENMMAEALSRAEAESVQQQTTQETEKEAGEESKHLRNQFNFSDRACQTVNPIKKTRSCYTEPPATTVRNGSCSQWDIYDDYCNDIEAQRYQEQQTKKTNTATKKTKNDNTEINQTVEAISDNRQTKKELVTLRAAKVLERMTMQNIFEEMVMDLKYWDDTSDEFRPNEASLLPLWKFQDKNSNNKCVTALCSNSRHSDVFAVGYGSYESLKQTIGVISVYSLKNPSVPEKTLSSESGILALAFHPDFPSLLAAGCYDGCIKVIDIKDSSRKPLYASNGQTERHTEPVWEVIWKSGTVFGELQLVSISADGTVGLWTFTRSEMLLEPIMTCNRALTTVNSEPSPQSLLCLDFNKIEETNYILGTEQGLLYRCSTEYDSEYLDCYFGHEMPVYSAKWNFFHQHVFISGSEDWTVKLWDSRNSKRPIKTYELNSPVTAIAWAPYSSTVFIAVTDSGRVYAFDLSINRHVAICEQKIISKGRLTRVLFHPLLPLLLVGDSTGLVSALKLSPNLRRDASEVIDGAAKDQQIMKLNAVLNQLNLSLVD